MLTKIGPKTCLDLFKVLSNLKSLKYCRGFGTLPRVRKLQRNQYFLTEALCRGFCRGALTNPLPIWPSFQDCYIYMISCDPRKHFPNPYLTLFLGGGGADEPCFHTGSYPNQLRSGARQLSVPPVDSASDNTMTSPEACQTLCQVANYTQLCKYIIN